MDKASVHLARHFWRDGEFASWKANQTFPSGLLVWLKVHYTELVSSRPQWIKRPEGMLWLFYYDEREVHGRLATKLVACWIAESVQNVDQVYTALKSCGDLMQNDVLSVTVHIRLLPQERYSVNLMLLMVILVLVAIVGYKLWLTVDKSMPDQPVILVLSPVSDDPSDRYQENIKPLSAHKPSLNPPVFEGGICAQIITVKNFCFQYFLAEKCDHSSTLHYNAWLKNLKTKDYPRFSGLGCPENKRKDRDLQTKTQGMSKKQQMAIENIMTGMDAKQ